MDNIIEFPEDKKNKKNRSHNQSNNKQQILNDTLHSPMLISDEEDKIFLEIIKEWPCFKELSQNLSLQEILEMYYDDELNVSQDYAIEYLFHMHEPNSPFDIANALYTWGESDKDFFILSITQHAELIKQIKKDEI